MNGNYNFISNNVKGVKASEKRLKLFEYLGNNFSNNGFIFLQETHSSSKDEQNLVILASCLKSVISTIVNENQVAYVNNSFISESGRLISGVLENTNSLKIEGLLMTVDIEKAFDSINHSFLICVLKKVGFGNEFRKWIQILVKKLESCVMNGGKTKPYFRLERGTRQEDPVSAYLFIIALEVVFSLIKANPNIKDLQFFSHTLLHSA